MKINVINYYFTLFLRNGTIENQHFMNILNTNLISTSPLFPKKHEKTIYFHLNAKKISHLTDLTFTFPFSISCLVLSVSLWLFFEIWVLEFEIWVLLNSLPP